MLISVSLTLSADKIINVLSLGCGPATELCALDNLREQKYIKGYNYTGVDKNNLWSSIQTFYQNHSYQNTAIKFEMNCALSFIDNCNIKQYDIIVFNYFLSDMEKFMGKESVKNLVNALSRKMLKANHYPSIIYNDARRDYGVNIMTNILANNPRYNKIKRYFPYTGEESPFLDNNGFQNMGKQYRIETHQKNACSTMGSTQIILSYNPHYTHRIAA